MRNRIALSLIPVFLCMAAQAQDIDANALYQQHCAQCHGADMRGGNAQSMLNGIWLHGEGMGYVSRNIKHGITHLGMPAYEAVLSDPEIRAIAGFILSAEREAGVERAPIPETGQSLDYEFNIEVFAEDVAIPWDIAWLDENTALITERPGGVRVVRNGELLPDPIANTPAVLHEGQGGMMAVAVDPEYSQNGWVYLGYTHAHAHDGRRQNAMTRIVRGKIENHAWTNEEVLFEAPQDTYLPTRIHYGTRIVFDEAGYLYFAIGERGMQQHAQELDRPNGKVHRIHRDGRIPEDNPFVGVSDAIRSIYSYGNRNPQGLSFDPNTGLLWSAEHGPMGGDELNVIRSGRNYGWPVITYGRNYNGTLVSAHTHMEGMEQPAWHWTPSTAVCGVAFYEGTQFPKWEGKLLVSALRNEQVSLVSVYEDRVIHEEIILRAIGRVRQAAPGPDGAVYVVTNNPDQVLRISVLRERGY